MIQGIILKLVETPILKSIVLFLLTISSFLVGTLYSEAIMATVMLMIIDFVTGLWATYIEKKPITSRRASRTVVKGLVYLLTISAAKFLDTTLPGDIVQYTIITFVSVTEFVSILENVGRMGFKTPKKLLGQLRDRL